MVIASLLLSILVEGAVVVAYALWREKPAARLLLAATAATALTQLMLWAALHLNPRHYLPTLFAAESLIWLIEAAFLYFAPGTQLGPAQALVLSLLMNLASFGIGWFLPV